MLKKIFLLFLITVYQLPVTAQFDESVSKIQLYNDALELNVYIQMYAKDKLYYINNLKKELSKKEMDYAYAKVNDNLSEIDLYVENPKVRQQVEKLKEFFVKFDEKSIKTKKLADFPAFYFEINVFDKMISDLIESMKVAYNFDYDQIKNYENMQYLRKHIQVTSLGYYASLLGLNQSFKHQYRKNIKVADAFIKDNSNAFLNDPVIGSYFPDFILDWNFLRAALQHEILSMPQTVFSMSVNIDYHFKNINNKYINILNKKL